MANNSNGRLYILSDISAKAWRLVARYCPGLAAKTSCHAAGVIMLAAPLAASVCVHISPLLWSTAPWCMVAVFIAVCTLKCWSGCLNLGIFFLLHRNSRQQRILSVARSKQNDGLSAPASNDSISAPKDSPTCQPCFFDGLITHLQLLSRSITTLANLALISLCCFYVCLINFPPILRAFTAVSICETTGICALMGMILTLHAKQKQEKNNN